MPGALERFDRLENTTSLSKLAPELVCGFQRAERRGLVEVDLGVALVGGDDEAVAVRKLEERAPCAEVEHLAGRVGRRAGVDELHAGPVRPAGLAVAPAWRRRAGRRPHRSDRTDSDRRPGRPRRIENGLGEGEKRLARAVDRQHLRLGIGRGDAVAAREPARDRLAQRRRAGGRRIGRQPVERAREGVAHQRRGRMLRLADREVDRRELRVRRHPGEQRAQLLERVGLELLQQRVQPRQPFLRCSATTVVWMPPRTLKRASRRM